VAIVGRPNVGKSSLLNRLAGKRISIVDAMSGVTRDRVTARIHIAMRPVELVDTGGIGIVDTLHLEDQVEHQIEAAVFQADVILFLVDVREGLTPQDREVAGRLRRTSTPVVLVGNKADSRRLVEAGGGELNALGFGEPLLISATQGHGIADLLDAVAGLLPPPEDGADAAAQEAEGRNRIKLALVGRQNAGKSSLLNRLAKAERVIVSEVPGTTRDAVDVRFELGGHVYVAIDTAGMRRRGKFPLAVDFFSQVRTERSIRQCDVALLLLDATQEVSIVDKNLAAYVRAHHRPCILVVNKWDLIQADVASPEDYMRYLRAHLPGLGFAPLAMVSALTGFNLAGLLDLSRSLFQQAGVRVATAEVNRVLEAARERQAPKQRRGKRPKLFYGTQVSVHPPTFVIFVNDPSLFDDEYTRYFENRFREAFPFSEVPVRIHFRRRGGGQDPAAETPVVPDPEGGA